jgi:hypothetical protein
MLAPAASGLITIGDVAARTDRLVVACNRCGWSIEYSIATLLQRYGVRYPIPSFLQKLQNGPGCEANRLDDVCGVNCPELAPLLMPTWDAH